MQTTRATQEEVASWKHIYAEYKPKLKPNRITGAALFAYLESLYPLKPLDDARANQLVVSNILENNCFAQDLPPDALPEPVCCTIERTGAGVKLYDSQDEIFSGIDIFVGIDLTSGYFTVEGSSLLWDELYAHRGLNEAELENFYCVAEYISCLKRFSLLEETLAK